VNFISSGDKPRRDEQSCAESEAAKSKRYRSCITYVFLASYLGWV